MKRRTGAWTHHLADVLRGQYSLEVSRIEALDLGADAATRVYRVEAHGAPQPFFLKTRPYAPVLPGVDTPAYFSSQNISHILAPIPARNGQAWVRDGGLSLMLYPFLPGASAMEQQMTARQWTGLGRVMRAVHNCTLPAHLAGALEQETFTAGSRRLAEHYLLHSLAGAFARTPGAAVADVLCRHAEKIRHLLRRAGELGAYFQGQPPRLVPCHADLHKWNLFIVSEGEWYILDWDTVKLAPPECDLMYIGANIGGDRGDSNEMPCFYEGYGEAPVDRQLVAYYRFERILVDIAEFGKQIWGTEGMPAGENNNGAALSSGTPEEHAMYEAAQASYTRIAGWMDGNFAPGNEYDTACRSDPG